MQALDEIGKQIATARKTRGLRQADVAREAGLSRATVDALENGRAADIRWSKLTRILRCVELEAVVQPAQRGRLTLDRLLAEAEDD
jgi:transcriptional regulator with XRE-family HTH domain